MMPSSQPRQMRRTFLQLRFLPGLLLGLGSLSLVAACADDGGGAAAPPGDGVGPTGPLMRPGQDCNQCHRPNNSFGAPVWTAGGTVLATTTGGGPIQGAVISITDADGKKVDLTSNAVGNFYTSTPLVVPYDITITYGGESRRMPFKDGKPNGSPNCNHCHAAEPPSYGALGHLRPPQASPNEAQ